MLMIEPAGLRDIPIIQSLSEKIWPEVYEPIIGVEQVRYMLHQMYSSAALEDQIKAGHQFIIGKMDDVALGFASYSEVGAFAWKLHKIYMLPAQHRKGLGKQLLEHIIKAISAEQPSTLTLNVNRH